MLFPFQKALLAGALLAVFLGASPAAGKDVYKGSLDPAIPHHAAILDTLSKIERNPSDATLHNDLGCLVAWDGFWRDALRSFDTAAKLAPGDSRPSFNAGLVQAYRGEWKAARSRFKAAVKTDPGNWPAWWMLGFAEETLGHENAAVAAYSRALRVNTALFDPKVNPFAVGTRLRARALLETYDRRLIEESLPFSNQLSDPSRVASFFQHRATGPKAIVEIEEPPRTGPVVTTVPPPMAARPQVTPPPAEPLTRRRRAYSARSGSEGEGPVEVSPAPVREAPEAAAPVTPPMPGLGTGSGAPGTGVVPGTAPAVAPPRRVPVPGPGGPPEPPDGE